MVLDPHQMRVSSIDPQLHMIDLLLFQTIVYLLIGTELLLEKIALLNEPQLYVQLGSILNDSTQRFFAFLLAASILSEESDGGEDDIYAMISRVSPSV
jgi:hypothetical protein